MKKQVSKLGKTTGSLFNYLMGNNQTVPVVGAGATIIHWSDRSAYEVMSVSEDGREVMIQRYEPVRTDRNGMSDDQDYEYATLTGEQTKLIWRNNAWRQIVSQVVWVDSYRDGITNEAATECFDTETCMLKLIPGKTRIQTTYPKVNIIFGVKREYYDYSF